MGVKGRKPRGMDSPLIEISKTSFPMNLNGGVSGPLVCPPRIDSRNDEPLWEGNPSRLG